METSRITASTAAFLALFRVQTDRPSLVERRSRPFPDGVPLLFFICIVNTLAVAYTYYGVAPAVLTIGCPILANDRLLRTRMDMGEGWLPDGQRRRKGNGLSPEADHECRPDHLGDHRRLGVDALPMRRPYAQGHVTSSSWG